MSPVEDLTMKGKGKLTRDIFPFAVCGGHLGNIHNTESDAGMVPCWVLTD